MQSETRLLTFLAGKLRGGRVVFELPRPYFFEKNDAACRELIIMLGNHAAKVTGPSEPVCSCGTLRTIDMSTKFGPKSSPEPAFLAS